MGISINDLDDDDVIVDDQQQEEKEQVIKQPTQPQEEVNDDDYISDFLKTRGIDDLEKINFEDDNGQLVERSWNDLSKEEKLNILNTPLEINNHQDNSSFLSEEEINLLNTIRQSNLSPSEYLNQLKGGEEVMQPQYKIDDLSDDEIYLLDLESRVGELSDEEAAQALAIAKQQSEELYKKQVEGIRKEYKEREDFQTQQEEAQREQEQQEVFEVYKNNVIDAINNFTSIGNLDLSLEDSDKEELAEFMLSQDETGKNYLFEALQDPETLTKAAWFILNGEEALNEISDYFKGQIKLASETQYKKGFDDGSKEKTGKSTLVIDSSKNINNRQQQYNSINDLDDDD